MKQFVFIFRQNRQSAPTVTPEEASRRREEIKAWAKQRIEEGSKFDPRELGHESFVIAPESDNDATGEKSIGNLLFLQAKDFDEAVKIAKTHPGARFGTHIEVREWAAPGLLAAQRP
jgi:hypothetical protein